MDLRERLLELGLQGFECSQIMMMIALELEEKENPDLIRAVSGLTGGMGHGGGTCGALTGGCGVLGLFTVKGDPEEMEDNRCHEIIRAYTTWFREQYTPQYGGTDCAQVIGGDFSKCLTVCASILEACCGKLLDLLTEYEILEG